MKPQQKTKPIWKEVKLGEITECLDNQRIPITESDRKKGNIPYYGANGQVGWIDKFIFNEKLLLLAEDGGSWGLNQKCSYIINGKSWVNNHVHVLRVRKHKVDISFLKYWLNKEDLNKYISGTTRGKLNQKIMNKIKIPLPPLPTQKQIVAILEKAEELKQRREKADKLTKEYLQSVFYEMFYNKDFEQIELGDKKICEIAGEYGSGASAIEYDGKVRYIRITDINEDGNLKDENVSPSKIEEKYFLEDGDLLFARSGATVGKTYLCKNKDRGAQYAGYLIRFRFNKKIISPEYIYYFTKTQKYLSWIKSKMKVVAQPNINAQQYSSIEIPLPPLPLQQKFASIVEKVEKMKEKQKKSKEEINLMFDALMQKAFKGELVR